MTATESERQFSQLDTTAIASKGISTLTPPSTGWLFAFVVIVLASAGINLYHGLQRMASVERLLVSIEEHRSEEIRRKQEIIEALSESLTRVVETQADALSDEYRFDNTERTTTP